MIPDYKIRIAVINDLPVIVSIYNEAVNLGYAIGDTQTKTVESMQIWFEEHIPSKYSIFILFLFKSKGCPFFFGQPFVHVFLSVFSAYAIIRYSAPGSYTSSTSTYKNVFDSFYFSF